MHYEKFQDGTVKCIEDEIPFEIPEGWAWCHYSDVIELYSEQGLTPDRYNDTGEGIPYITGASNLEHGKVTINRWTITPTTHATICDLLLTVKGSGVGKMAFCDIIDVHIARQLLQIWSAVCCKSKRKLKFSPCTNLIFGIFFTDISRIIFPLIINYRWNILMFSFRLNNTDKFCSHKQRIICLAFFADSGICWPFSNRHVTTFRKSCTF